MVAIGAETGRSLRSMTVKTSTDEATESDCPRRSPRRVNFSFQEPLPEAKSSDEKPSSSRRGTFVKGAASETLEEELDDPARLQQWKQMIYRRKDTFARLMGDGEETEFFDDLQSMSVSGESRDRSQTMEAEAALELAMMAFNRQAQGHNPHIYRGSNIDLTTVMESEE